MDDEKSSYILIDLEDVDGVRVTLFLTDEDMEKYNIRSTDKMGTAYGTYWYVVSDDCPKNWVVYDPEVVDGGCKWVFFGTCRRYPAYKIVENDYEYFPVRFGASTISVDYDKWMKKDTRKKLLFRFECVESRVASGYVWACSEKQARLFLDDYMTGECEYQEQETGPYDWEFKQRDSQLEPCHDTPAFSEDTIVIGASE